jgi:hypothetical protein
MLKTIEDDGLLDGIVFGFVDMGVFFVLSIATS